jgi:hypothetical protein
LNILEGDSSEETSYRLDDYKRFRELSGQIRSLERATILHMRNQDQISDEVMRRLEHEIDLMEARFSASDHE